LTVIDRDGLLTIGDWLFSPEGAIVHRNLSVAVIADLHLGYEWARGRAGDSIPPHSWNQTRTRLERLIDRLPNRLSRLVVAGDLVESRRPCRRTAEDFGRLRSWLENKEIAFVPLAGNHDPRELVLDATTHEPELTVEIGGWTIGHGHLPIMGGRVVSGHHHPVFRYKGMIAPCFLVGERRIILPAFSENAAGLDVLTQVAVIGPGAADSRCLVSTGTEVLDFGPLASLSSRMRGAGPFNERKSGR
jgi:metallophosphoesterase superfamily enzyme